MRPYKTFSLPLAKIAQISGALASSLSDMTDIAITGISHSDVQIQPGDLFVAVSGAKHHGAKFSENAKAKGAVAALTDAEGAKMISGIPVLIVNNPRAIAGEIAALLYNDPMRELGSIAITGTNGKTTVTTLLYQIMTAANRECGLIGTIETRVGNEIITSERTTPEATELQAMAAVMKERHIRHLVMEASSHAMTMHRIAGAHFAIVGFTNLTQDHLDFHGDMESYFAAKASLFKFTFADLACINVDDIYGARLAASVEIPVITLSRKDKTAEWHFVVINNFTGGTDLKIRGKGGIMIETTTSLRGGYNMDNLLMAIAIAYESGVDPIDIAAIVPRILGAAGRFEEVKLGQKFTALVDYAHTPDALDNVLNTIREFTSGKIIAVLGCGGDRDSGKRPAMGAGLAALSDIAVFTSDNPRSEDPTKILNEMVGNLVISPPSRVIVDRAKAIAYAVSLASAGDTVAILGKGHELGQEISGENLDFDDRIILASAIEAKI
jgi:UDP-N-acetylmuramoyl-L-alanyl-D-glutamate--2,6-diaminopimelate ligase|tara:strand:- start:1631 stop:3121 length:1491 start_codon:yes stop_codon:yes gene_type:complete